MNLDKLNSTEVDIDLTLLPSGEILFNRDINEDINKALICFLENLGIEKEEIEEFFNCADNIQQLIGDESFCG
jgi:hypothetical protein